MQYDNTDYSNQSQKYCDIYIEKHYINYINFAIDTIVFLNDYWLFAVSKALSDKFQLIQSITICTDIY